MVKTQDVVSDDLDLCPSSTKYPSLTLCFYVYKTEIVIPSSWVVERTEGHSVTVYTTNTDLP